MATSAQLTRRSAGWHSLLTRVSARGPAEPVRLVVLMVWSMIVLGMILRWPDGVPRGSFAPLVVLAGLGLGLHRLLIFYGWIIGCYLLSSVLGDTGPMWDVSVAATLLSIMGAMFYVARAREGLGVYGVTGEYLLRDLRRTHGQLGDSPALPQGWHVERSVLGAHGDNFFGDVLLSAEGFHPHHAEFCLVDISGKGLRAGTRAMNVASAFSGLLGQVAPSGFLEAANNYLCRQQWAEGFATAVHVDLDPVTGHFSVSGAGHPPAMRYDARNGTCEEVCGQSGPALGIMENMAFPGVDGELAVGDALILFTDGVIESRTGELADGIDWVGGMTERHVMQGGFSGLADVLTRSALAGEGDDRAALVIWRQ